RESHVEVARRPAVRSGSSLPSQPDALPIPGPCFAPNLQRFRALDGPFTMASRAGRDVLPGPMAARALHVELHPPARLLNGSLAMTLRTNPRGLDTSRSVTAAARFPESTVQ